MNSEIAKNSPADGNDRPTDDLDWFLRNARSEKAGLAAFYAERGYSMYEVGQKAGFSAGNSDDPVKQKATLAAAASRACNSRRTQELRARFRDYKAAGDRPVAGQDELRARLSAIALGDNQSSSIQASKVLLEEQRRAPLRDLSPDRIPTIVNTACNRDNLLLQVCGVAAGLIWRSGGLPGFENWEVPEKAAHIERVMKSTGLEPLEVLSILGTQTHPERL